MRVGCYIRVSTEEQARGGYGLDEQRDKLTAYSLFKGWSDLIWYEDAGVSGGSMNRPGLGELLEAVDAGTIQVVLTTKADRLSRKLKDLLILIEDRLEPKGVAFISANENFDTGTASGKAFLSMLGTFAELERNVITERTIGGKKQKAKQGGYPGGEPALGYRSKDKTLVIDQEQAETIRTIYSLREAGKTLQAIVDHLTVTGTPTKKGGRWHRRTVSYILDNAKYKGLLQSNFAGERIEAEAPELQIA